VCVIRKKKDKTNREMLFVSLLSVSRPSLSSVALTNLMKFDDLGNESSDGEREREREMGRWDGVGRKRWRSRAPFVGSRVEIGGLRWSERAGQCRRWVAGAVLQGSTVCWVPGGDRWPAAAVV
jgi:hypothetical protein